MTLCIESADVYQEKIVDAHDTFLFDCDGVLWQGPDGIPGSVPFVRSLMAAVRFAVCFVYHSIHLLSQKGKTVVFITNNATKEREEYVKKFASKGLTVEKRQIFTAAYAAAAYLSSLNFQK